MSSLKCNTLRIPSEPFGPVLFDEFGINLARRAKVEPLAGAVIETANDCSAVVGSHMD